MSSTAGSTTNATTNAQTKVRPAGGSGATSTRERLLDVGLDLMRRQGYGATGLQELLRAAGVPKGSFYHHFASKEEFAAAVIERYVAAVGAQGEETLGNLQMPPLRRLRSYFEALILAAGQGSATPGCLLGSLSLEVSGVSPLLQGCLHTSFTHWQGGVTQVLQEAVEKGDLPASTQVDALAGFVLNSWEGALLRSQADRSDLPLRDFLHYVFDQLLPHES